MSFVQTLKRLVTKDPQPTPPTNGTTTTDTNQSVTDNSTTTNNSTTNSNGTHSAVSTSKSTENFKPLSQGLQKKYARGVQYNSKSWFN